MGIKSKTDLYLPEFNFQNQNGVYISDADFSSKLVNFQEGLKIVDFWKKKNILLVLQMVVLITCIQVTYHCLNKQKKNAAN